MINESDYPVRFAMDVNLDSKQREEMFRALAIRLDV